MVAPLHQHPPEEAGALVGSFEGVPLVGGDGGGHGSRGVGVPHELTEGAELLVLRCVKLIGLCFYSIGVSFVCSGELLIC